MKNMTEGEPLKLIIPFMIPLLIGNVFQQLYNIADIIIVGRTIGVNALAAVGATAPLFMMLVILTLGMSGGFSVVTGQLFGAGDLDGVRRSAAMSTMLCTMFVIIMMAAAVMFIDPVLALMNIPPELYADAKSYVMIIVYGLIFMMAYNMLSNILRSLGDSKTPLYFFNCGHAAQHCSGAGIHYQLWLGRAGKRAGACSGAGLFRAAVHNLYCQKVSGAACAFKRF